MDGRALLTLVVRRWRTIATFVLAGWTVAMLITVMTPVQYESSSRSIVASHGSSRVVSQNGDSLAAANEANQLAVGRLPSYVQLVSSTQVMSAVIKQLKLKLTPAQLAQRVTATAIENTLLIEITARDATPAGAQRIVGAIDTAFARTVADLESSPGVEPPVEIVNVWNPTLPERASQPLPELNLPLGLIAGLLAGLAAAIARDALDTRLRTSADVQRASGRAPLSVIPFDRHGQDTPLLTARNKAPELTNAYERLRAQTRILVRPSHALVVAADTQGVDKTLVACNLAVSLAMSDARVALVDADLRDPQITELTQLTSAYGLSDVLAGRATLDEALVSLPVDSSTGTGQYVTVLTSGIVPPNPNELLSSPEFAKLLDVLARDADVIIIDAPALDVAVDAATLAEHTDGVLLVVSGGTSSTDSLTAALGSLTALRINLLGTVLTSSTRTRSRRRSAPKPGVTAAAPAPLDRPAVSTRFPWESEPALDPAPAFLQEPAAAPAEQPVPTTPAPVKVDLTKAEAKDPSTSETDEPASAPAAPAKATVPKKTTAKEALIKEA